VDSQNKSIFREINNESVKGNSKMELSEEAIELIRFEAGLPPLNEQSPSRNSPQIFL